MMNKKITGQHTPEELVESTVFPVSMPQSRKKKASRQLSAARAEGQQKMTDKDKLALQLYQLKFQLEDYIQHKEFKPNMTFGHFLKRYVSLLQVKRKDFAYDISIDETLLSQFINQHRMPPEYVAVRLEIHSNNTIPANYWFKLVTKQREHELKTDKALRKKEKKFVHRKLGVSI
jgi:hypothetical protein